MSVIYVAVAIIINQQNQVLIAKRAAHQHQGDKWEFPGGKVEKGETSKEALIREILEEVGIVIKSPDFMFKISHGYDDKDVLLDIYKVEDWAGKAVGKEGQLIKWINKHDLKKYEFPAANEKIVRMLSQ